MQCQQLQVGEGSQVLPVFVGVAREELFQRHLFLCALHVGHSDAFLLHWQGILFHHAEKELEVGIAVGFDVHDAPVSVGQLAEVLAFVEGSGKEEWEEDGVDGRIDGDIIFIVAVSRILCRQEVGQREPFQFGLFEFGYGPRVVIDAFFYDDAFVVQYLLGVVCSEIDIEQHRYPEVLHLFVQGFYVGLRVLLVGKDEGQPVGDGCLGIA